jgi:hypothetical protein
VELASGETLTLVDKGSVWEAVNEKAKLQPLSTVRKSYRPQRKQSKKTG